MSPSKRKLPVTDDQKDALLVAMSKHEGLSTKKLTTTFTYKKYNDDWAKLANKLNDLGPSKSVKEWQKYWNDRRSRLKRKIAVQKKSKLDTSGNEIIVTDEGSPEIDNLSIYEKKVLEVCGGQTWYQRRPSTKELGAFTFPIELEKTTITESMSTESTITEATVSDPGMNNQPNDKVEEVFVVVKDTDSVQEHMIGIQDIRSMPRRKLARNRKRLNKSPSRPEESSRLLELQKNQIQLKREKLALFQRKVEIAERNALAAEKRALAAERKADAAEELNMILKKISSHLLKSEISL